MYDLESSFDLRGESFDACEVGEVLAVVELGSSAVCGKIGVSLNRSTPRPGDMVRFGKSCSCISFGGGIGFME